MTNSPWMRIFRELGKPKYWITLNPKVLNDQVGQFPLVVAWQAPRVYLFVTGTTKWTSYLVNPKLGCTCPWEWSERQRESYRKRSKGTKNSKGSPLNFRIRWGFDNWRRVVQQGMAHGLVFRGRGTIGTMIRTRVWISSAHGVCLLLLSFK